MMCLVRPRHARPAVLFFSDTCNLPTLAGKLDDWRQFVDGPIEAVELDCNHREMLLPELIARPGPTVSNRMAAGAAMSA